MVMRRGLNTYLQYNSHICNASYMEFLVMYYWHCRCLGPESIDPAVGWLRIRSVEDAALVIIYAVWPPVWIEQVAEGVVPRSI